MIERKPPVINAYCANLGRPGLIWRKCHGRNQARFSLAGTAGGFLVGFTSP